MLLKEKCLEKASTPLVSVLADMSNNEIKTSSKLFASSKLISFDFPRSTARMFSFQCTKEATNLHLHIFWPFIYKTLNT